MPNIVMTKLKNQPKDKSVRLKIFDFLEKLAEDDSTYGLRVKKMNRAVDPRARTARIDQSWRAVLYLLEDKNQERTWVFAGAWEHDVAIERARTLKVDLNEVNGAVQLIAATMPIVEARPSTIAPSPAASSPGKSRFLEQFNYSLSNLVEELGFPPSIAQQLLDASTEDDVLAIAEGLENAWEQDAAVSLAAGASIDAIREELRLETPTHEAEATEDERILRAFDNDVSKMQFTFVEDNEELRKIIEDGDFAAWRVFLHPEQARYSTADYAGPFRLSGGAGTGKTVVLLHRARHLMAQNPDARVVLTTYTRALAENLKRDLLVLQPDIRLASDLGERGVLIRGVDQLGAAVRQKAGTAFGQAASIILGEARGRVAQVHGNREGWAAAADAVTQLPSAASTDAFLESEYLQVILPARVSSREEYFAIRRPGRIVALDRKKREAVWSIVERYRENARSTSSLSYAEVAEIGAAWLDLYGEELGVLADHVLVDEGQDLSPSQWKLLRALARPGRNDMFIAEDAHQRIYGHPVVLARCGIAIVGRSRRLTLNYRTTAENLAFAIRSLADGDFLDAEGGATNITGYHSARRGPTPVVLGAANEQVQLDQVGDLVERWLDDDTVDAGTVAVLARTNDRALAVRDALVSRGIPANHVKSAQPSSDRVLTLTMHTSKGMEFSRVVLFDISEGAVPSKWVLDHAAPEERDDVMLQERSLLYVAASRARDALAVTWSGAPSPLLHEAAPGRAATDQESSVAAV